MLKKGDRANVERRLLRWGLYTGVLPCTMDESGRLHLSVVAFVCATVLLIITHVAYAYLTLLGKKSIILHTVIVVVLLLNVSKTAAMLLTTRRRIKTAENCFKTFREIDLLCGPVEVKGWSVYRTNVCMLLPLVANMIVFLSRLLVEDHKSTDLNLLTLSMVLMRAVHMMSEMTFNILVYELGTRVRLSMQHDDATDTVDSGAVERRLRIGCTVQRLVRLRERELCGSYGASLLLVVVGISCDFIVTFYFIIGIYSKASVLEMAAFALIISMHLWELLIVADPCDRLHLYYERSLNEMNFALSAHGSRLAPSSYRELRHWLSLLGSAAGETRVLDLFCLGRAVLLPIASFASTYVIVLVQIYDGSI